jgi:hypothetical protein
MSFRLRYCYRYTVTPFHRYRDRPSAIETIPLPYRYLTVTDHYSLFPTVTVADRSSSLQVTFGNGE